MNWSHATPRRRRIAARPLPGVEKVEENARQPERRGDHGQQVGDPPAKLLVLAWLIDEGHVREVCRVGRATAEVVRIDAESPTVEVRYTFASREAFAAYERDHAPRLRAEGAERFAKSARFARATGERIFVADGDEGHWA